MEIRINDNIRRLRKEKNLTQEALANMLSITPQSISKWERGEGYPDITMLPSLANCLGVSIDVLLGNDLIIAEERIQNYLSEYKRLTADDVTWPSAFAVAQNAYEEFSYDYRIMMLYVNALKIFHPANSEKEIERICKTVLQHCEDRALRTDASYFLCGFRNADDRMGFLKKYIEYGQDWNWFAVYPHDSEEGKIMMQHEILDKWWHLNMYIYTYGDLFNEDANRTVSHEEKIALIKKCERILAAVMDEGDYGEYTWYLGQYNEFLAREYAALGKTEETLYYFEKAVEGWIAYDTLPDEYTYKNILMTHRPYAKENIGQNFSSVKRYKAEVENNPDFDFVRNTEQYRKNYEKLCVLDQ
ncbi:MAG: helix-turn-helix transcriptional regulator [Clostridia bacterium]|nr:helix-turn-helix transcriptional regulator [Clostridia bacterium]